MSENGAFEEQPDELVEQVNDTPPIRQHENNGETPESNPPSPPHFSPSAQTIQHVSDA